MTDIGRNITSFLHCRECLEEWKAGEAPGESPASYARFSVGWTALGLQIICNRHDLNVAHIDFEGAQHPADLSREGDFAGSYWARIEARQAAKQRGKEEWQATGRDVPDLRECEDEIGTIGAEDRPYPGRVYEPGYMETVDGGFMVTVGNQSEIYAELDDAEQALWNWYASEFYEGQANG